MNAEEFEKLCDCNIVVEGECSTELREEAIEEAIKIIQENSDYLNNNFICIKNYAGFGDQREDHSYGRCPRYGCIVFRIDKIKINEPFTDKDIKYLLHVRDNPDISFYHLKRESLMATEEIIRINKIMEKIKNSY